MHLPGVGGCRMPPLTKLQSGAPDAAAVPPAPQAVLLKNYEVITLSKKRNTSTTHQHQAAPHHTHLGVCLDMMYCWGGAYRGSSRYWLGT